MPEGIEGIEELSVLLFETIIVLLFESFEKNKFLKSFLNFFPDMA